jgi:uncharacterized protein YggU (UPF0235/DUF167 family)
MTAGARLFGRVVRVTVTPEAGKPTIINTFDVAFEVEKTIEQEPNKGKVTIYNLPEDLRSRFQSEKSVVTLEAGYKKTVAQIFKAEIRVTASKIVEADWETTIELREHDKAYRQSVVAKSFGAGTPLKVVVNAITKSFTGLKVSAQATKLLASVADTLPAGLTIDGPSAKVLNDVLRGAGLAWSVQNGEIQILASGKASDAPPILLDYSSGLIGVPEPAESKEDKKFLKLTSLLQPDLVPGRRVRVDSPLVRGDYVCQKVTHKGSTFDNEYYSHAEAVVPS